VKARRRRCILALGFGGLVGIGLLAAVVYWRHGRNSPVPRPLPSFPTAQPYTPWPTPPIADRFDFPLLPAEAYGPYVAGVTGPLAVDTRYGVQNPAMGARSNCFRDASDNPVPFDQLYHAGIDLFALNGAGRVVWGQVANVPVHAVADGVVIFRQDAGADGHIVITEHRPGDGDPIYSVYWHVDQVQVAMGQPVTCGQAIAVVADRGFNSHLHWEMRGFADGSSLFSPGTAGARGTCNGRFAGVGYAWDDDPARAHPDAFGYVDPVAFVTSHQSQSP